MRRRGEEETWKAIECGILTMWNPCKLSPNWYLISRAAGEEICEEMRRKQGERINAGEVRQLTRWQEVAPRSLWSNYHITLNAASNRSRWREVARHVLVGAVKRG